MDDTACLSQGVFIDKPKKGKNKKEKLSNKCFGAFDEPQETIPARIKLYREYFNHIKNKIDILEDEWNRNVKNQVTAFIELSLDTIKTNEMVTPLGFIPTGFCSEETTKLFDGIEREVLEQVKFVARVSSSKCPNVKVGFQNICKQLIHRNNLNVSHFHDTSGMVDLDDSLMDEESISQPNSRYISVHDLQMWYKTKSQVYFDNPLLGESPSLKGKGLNLNTTTPVRSSSTRKEFGTPNTPKSVRRRTIGRLGGKSHVQIIIIILENADYFQKNVVAELLKVLSCAKLPFVFLLGVNQCFVDVSRFIPTSSSTAFTHKTFNCSSNTEKLIKVVKHIMFDPKVPFKLSADVLKYICSYMTNQNFSIARLLQAYQICLVDHFRRAESIFCINNDTDLEQLEILKASYQPLTIYQTAAKGKPTKTVKDIKERIKESQILMQDWFYMFNILYTTKKSIRRETETLRELYVSCASGNFFEPNEETRGTPWDRLLKELHLLHKTELSDLLDDLYIHLKNYVATNLEDNHALFKTDIEDFVVKIEEFQTAIRDIDEEAENKKTIKSPLKSSIRIQENMKKEDLQKKLLENIRGKNCSTAFQKLRVSFVEFFEKGIKKRLKPLGTIRNSQIFVYNNLNSLKSLFSPSPQLNITFSLGMPGKILNCNCCKDTPIGSIPQDLPDVSIVYKLLQEQVSKKVDLNYIYEGFASIIEPLEPTQAKRRKSVSTKSQNNKDLQLIRFRQAVAELQHVGVLKRSKTKPDEVTKLVWQ